MGFMNESSVGAAVIAQGKDLHRLIAATSKCDGITLLAAWCPDPVERAAAAARYLLSVHDSIGHMLSSVPAEVVLVGGFGTIDPSLQALDAGRIVASLPPFCKRREMMDRGVQLAISSHLEAWLAIGPAWPPCLPPHNSKPWQMSEQVVWHRDQFL